MKDFYLNIELSQDATLPTRAHPTDAGLDVYASKDFLIPYRGDITHQLGIKVEFPPGYYLQIVDKSGRSTKQKIMVGAGVIDSDYRGIVAVHLFNFCDRGVRIHKGEKIAQIIVHKIWTGLPTQVDHIEENTLRGKGGFGSTGLTNTDKFDDYELHDIPETSAAEGITIEYRKTWKPDKKI